MIKRAHISDIPILIEHHVAMFREIYTLAKWPIDEKAFDKIAPVYESKLHRQLADNTCIAWVQVVGSNIVASAAVSLLDGVPIPADPSVTVGLLHSVYTIPACRNKGYAQQLVQTIMDYCKECNINRIDLVASDSGRHIYKKMGFTEFNSAMRFIRA